jgi:hypothetical protein
VSRAQQIDTRRLRPVSGQPTTPEVIRTQSDEPFPAHMTNSVRLFEIRKAPRSNCIFQIDETTQPYLSEVFQHPQIAIHCVFWYCQMPTVGGRFHTEHKCIFLQHGCIPL